MVAENKEHKKMLSAVSEATNIVNEQIDSINKDLAVDSLEILLKEMLKIGNLYLVINLDE